MNITLTAAPLPANWSGNPQQLLEAFIDRIEISVDGTSFVISDTQPQGNQGPWLKDGTQWWVWDVDTSTYIPLDLSASVSQQIFIGDVANGPPDSSTFSLWLQTNGSSVNGLFWFAGGTAGWVTTPKELVNGAVTLAMLAPQAAGSLITFNTNQVPVALVPGGAGTFLQSTGNGLQWSNLFVVHGTPVFITPVTLVSASTVTSTWTTISGLDTHGVPDTASAVILWATVFSNQGGTFTANFGVQIRPSSSGATYPFIDQQTGSSNDTTSEQAIFPIAVAGSTVSVDYFLFSGTQKATIQLIGYIT
jgi:hypothetical protein